MVARFKQGKSGGRRQAQRARDHRAARVPVSKSTGERRAGRRKRRAGSADHPPGC